MTVIELKRLYHVKAKGRDYYYAWRGGPAVKGEPGTPEFVAAYNDAVEGFQAPDKKRFRSVITRYRNSKDYRDLADSTKRNWGPWLDQIAEYFGKLRTKQFDRTEQIRKLIRQWRGQYSDNPRKADYGMQVLSRVCAYCVDPLGEIAANPCEGIKQLYSADRAAIIWTDVDIAHLKQTCSAEIAYAVELAAHTGLRAGDLVKLSWSHVGDKAIVMNTGKSRGRKQAIIPLYQELRDLLDRIPRRSTTILTSSTKRPWHKDGLSSSFAAAKKEAWPEGDNLHFHDLRGTAATKFYLAGLSLREIAEIMGWEEDFVERIIKRYVSQTAALEDKIRRMDEARERQKSVLPASTETKG